MSNAKNLADFSKTVDSGGNLTLENILITNDRGSGTEELTIFHENNVSYFISDSGAGGGAKGEFSFRTNDGGTAGERVRIDGDGNVGIGIASPSRQLVVYDSTQSNIVLQNGSSGTTLTDGFQMQYDGTAYLWNYENSAMLFGTNSTERMRIDSDGNLGIGLAPTNISAYKTLEIGQKSGSKRGRIQFNTDQGNITLYSYEQGTQPYLGFYTDHASGTYIARFDSDGLKFGQDTAAANALDDYEEGTFTPSFSNDGTTTYTTRSGEYIKIGSVVYYSILIRINTEDSSKTGSAEVIGLPFASKSSATTYYAASVVGDNNWDSAASNLGAYIRPNESKVLFYKNSGSNLSLVSINDIGSDGILYITGWYAT